MFRDIEASTRVSRRDARRMAVAPARHDASLANA
jgi:hypothetical protein